MTTEADLRRLDACARDCERAAREADQHAAGAMVALNLRWAAAWFCGLKWMLDR